MIETSSVAPRKIFANIRKMSERCSETFAFPSKQFWKIFGKWSVIFEISSKSSSLVCLCNQQNITCPLVNMNFICSCSTRHLTRWLRSLVRYRIEHSKTNFISTRGHVILRYIKEWVTSYLVYNLKGWSISRTIRGEGF